MNSRKESEAIDKHNAAVMLLIAERDRLREALQGMMNAYAPNAERTVAREGAQALQRDVRRALQALGCIMPDDQAKAKGE